MAGRVSVKSEALHPMGFVQITILTSATALTVPSNADSAIVIPTNKVNWRDDGTAPTSTVGMPLLADLTLHYDGDLGSVRFIQASGSAALNVSFYR